MPDYKDKKSPDSRPAASADIHDYPDPVYAKLFPELKRLGLHTPPVTSIAGKEPSKPPRELGEIEKNLTDEKFVEYFTQLSDQIPTVIQQLQGMSSDKDDSKKEGVSSAISNLQEIQNIQQSALFKQDLLAFLASDDGKNLKEKVRSLSKNKVLQVALGSIAVAGLYASDYKLEQEIKGKTKLGGGELKYSATPNFGSTKDPKNNGHELDAELKSPNANLNISNDHKNDHENKTSTNTTEWNGSVGDKNAKLTSQGQLISKDGNLQKYNFGAGLLTSNFGNAITLAKGEGLKAKSWFKMGDEKFSVKPQIDLQSGNILLGNEVMNKFKNQTLKTKSKYNFSTGAMGLAASYASEKTKKGFTPDQNTKTNFDLSANADFTPATEDAGKKTDVSFSGSYSKKTGAKDAADKKKPSSATSIKAGTKFTDISAHGKSPALFDGNVFISFERSVLNNPNYMLSASAKLDHAYRGQGTTLEAGLNYAHKKKPFYINAKITGYMVKPEDGFVYEGDDKKLPFTASMSFLMKF